MRKASLLSLILLLIAAVVKAQETQPEMADVMRSNGKIYVVVLVLATIFAGIIVYLVRLDRKITKIEKNS
jgi:multisubunit Na+/H+ antiporter MnhB subunit